MWAVARAERQGSKTLKPAVGTFPMEGERAKRATVERIVQAARREAPEPIRSSVLALLAFPRRPCRVLGRLDELATVPGEYEIRRSDETLYVVVSEGKVSDAVLDVVRTLGTPVKGAGPCEVYEAKSDKGAVLAAYDGNKNAAVVMVKGGPLRFYVLRRP